ncbi:MAG: helicase-related protein [Bacteroidales bacterium]
MATQFFTNKSGNTLIREFEGILSNNKSIKNLDAIVGFLRASGYFSLRPFLNDINKVRILIGIDVDKYIAKAANTGLIFYGAEEEVKEDCIYKLKRDIETSKYTKEVEDGIFQMIEDIKSSKLELRAHPSKRIHAKVYVLYPDGFNKYTMGASITGSSNLSGNGLGISADKQYEFNVKLTNYEDVKFAKDEFEDLWKEAEGCPIQADDVEGIVTNGYLKGDVTPYELYIKMLMEYFKDRVEGEETSNAFDLPDGYTRFDYQIDAVIEGYQKMLKYDGFFLADVVGLGKTVIATMIAKKFLLENGRDNTKILVVYPPAVEQNWKTTFKDFGIDKYTKFVSNGSLSKVIDAEDFNYWNPEEYDLILVDEAHKFRSHTTNAFEQLQEICKMPRVSKGNILGYKKKVMLISATPMNNTPADIYNEILLFQDPRRCTIDGITNLTATFSPLILEFKKLKANPEYNLAEFKKLAEQVRERIVKPLTVRRTRHDISSVQRYSKDVSSFSKVEDPIKKEYELNDHLAGLFEEAMSLLADQKNPMHLTYARYQAIAFLLKKKSNGLYDNADLISRSLASISKNGLVKRLESSFHAFKASLKKFRDANQYMINMFENDKVFIAPDLDINHLYDLGMSDDEIEEKLFQKSEDNPKNQVFQAVDFEPQFLNMLKKDQKTLSKMCEDWKNVTDEDDSKFDTFQDLLNHELFKKSRNPGQKLVVFSESLVTVNYLKERIKRDDVLVISAENRNRQFKIIRENFDANCPVKKNDYNILITTDVLAEGVNLHRSNIVVNYDTPWNSTKLMQRIGRVNRIGSTSKSIYNYVFYPSRQGNNQINLKGIVLSKIQTFHTTFGEDNRIYSKEEIIDRNLDKLFDEGIKPDEEDKNLEIPFYEELRELFTTNRKEYNRISNLPLRSRTGRKSKVFEGVKLSNETLVFIKTNLRKVFFRASDYSTEEITAVDAMNYFKASVDEPKEIRIQNHHEHVQKACSMFIVIRNKEYSNLEGEGKQQGNLGSQVTSALVLLNKLINQVSDEDTRLKVIHLKSLTERGVITYIPKRLQRLSKLLNSHTVSYDDLITEVIAMANKYDVYFQADDSLRNIQETDPEILLSESFN